MATDKENAIQSLKTARGQLDGVIKMIEDRRYCMDISNQLVAAQALVKKAQILILKRHIGHCVTDAVEAECSEAKIEEITKFLEKILK